LPINSTLLGFPRRNKEIDKLKETKEEEKKGKTWLNEALRV